MNETVKGHIVILLTNIIFGINTPLAKNALSSVGPYAMTTFRFAGCTVLFWAASLILHPPKINKKDIGLLCIASLFGIVFNLFLFILGLYYTTPTNASIIVSMTPIFTMILAFVFLREPLTIKKALGVACGLTGALILIFTKQGVSAMAKNNTLGIIFVVISSISYAIYLTLFSKLIKRNHPVNIMKWMFLASTIVVLPITYPHLRSLDFASITSTTWLEISYVVVLATFLNYLFIPMGQARLRPTTLSMYNYVQPVVTTTIAIITMMDVLTIYKVLAAILIFSGVYIVTTSRSKKQTEEIKNVANTLEDITSQIKK